MTLMMPLLTVDAGTLTDLEAAFLKDHECTSKKKHVCTVKPVARCHSDCDSNIVFWCEARYKIWLAANPDQTHNTCGKPTSECWTVIPLT